MTAERQLSLTARTVRGAGWTVAWRIATRLLGAASTLLLVRLLLPTDFGLVALGTTFSQTLDGLSDLGVDSALVREQQLDRAMYDTGFTLTVIRGALTALLICLLAHPIAQFFSEPRLTGVLLALAVAMFIGAVENIGIVDFQRALAFEKEFALLLAPRIAGVIVCVVTAYVWRTYWALVAGILTQRSMRTIGSYFMHSYRPRLSFRAWDRIIGFSFWSWLLTLASLVRDRIDTFTVGRMLGAAQVGIFSIGWDVGSMTSTEVVVPICRALLPGLAQVRNRGGDVSDAYVRAIIVSFVMTLPAGIGLALVADPLIRLAIGVRWVQAIPLVQVFAIVGVFKVIAFISTTLLTVYGLLRVQLATTLGTTAARFALLLVLITYFGLVGAALAVGIVAALEEAIYLTLTFRKFNIRPLRLLLNTWRAIAAASAMAIAVEANMMLDAHHGGIASVGQLCQFVVVGASVYALVLLSLWVGCGRPSGPESQAVGAILELFRSVQRRFMR